MPSSKPCKDCGQLLNWTPFEVNQQGQFLRDAQGKAIVHHCERPASGGGTTTTAGEQEPTMPFGKYKGQTIRQVAASADGIDYLKWALDKADKPWLREAIAAALQGHYGAAMRISEQPHVVQRHGGDFVDVNDGGDSWE